jgi:hypothetical protein
VAEVAGMIGVEDWLDFLMFVVLALGFGAGLVALWRMTPT